MFCDASQANGPGGAGVAEADPFDRQQPRCAAQGESLAGSKSGILTLLSRAHPQHLGGAEVLEVWAVAVSCSVRAPGGHGGSDGAVAQSSSARCGA